MQAVGASTPSGRSVADHQTPIMSWWIKLRSQPVMFAFLNNIHTLECTGSYRRPMWMKCVHSYTTMSLSERRSRVSIHTIHQIVCSKSSVGNSNPDQYPHRVCASLDNSKQKSLNLHPKN